MKIKTRIVSDEDQWLLPGKEYPVVGIEIGENSTEFRVLGEEQNTPFLVDSASVEITDPTIPSNWSCVEVNDRALIIQPAKWNLDNFWLRFFDGDEEIAQLYQTELSHMK